MASNSIFSTCCVCIRQRHISERREETEEEDEWDEDGRCRVEVGGWDRKYNYRIWQAPCAAPRLASRSRPRGVEIVGILTPQRRERRGGELISVFYSVTALQIVKECGGEFVFLSPSA